MKEGHPLAKQGKSHALALRTSSPGECSFSVGAAQASDALTIPVCVMQGFPARVRLMA